MSTRSLSLLAAGAVLGATATLMTPVRAQQGDSSLPEALKGEVAVFQGEGRLSGKILGIVRLGEETFVRLHPETGPDRYVNLRSVTVLLPK